MKLAIFQDTGWSLGQLYSSVAPYVKGKCLEWSRAYDQGTFEEYDRVLTLAGEGSRCLACRYGVPRRKILVVAHAEQDLIRLLKYDGDGGVREYAGFAVVSDTLACASLSIGITRVPTVLRQGISRAFYRMPVPRRLRVVGYAALLERSNEYGVEIKRGDLVRRAVGEAGLEWRPALPPGGRLVPRAEMPSYYAGVDAVVCSSLQEGGAMPPYEAAAAGRLVIGTPVGDFPRLAYEGMGVLAPLNDEQFVEFLSATLGYYRRNPEAFRAKCRGIQLASRGRDWSVVARDWVRFVKESS